MSDNRFLAHISEDGTRTQTIISHLEGTAQDQGDHEHPAVTPVNLVLDVAVVERDDGSPSRLSSLCENLPIGYQLQHDQRQNKKPNRADEADYSAPKSSIRIVVHDKSSLQIKNSVNAWLIGF